VLRMINERGYPAGELRLRPEHLVEIVNLVESEQITTSTGKALLDKVEESGRSPTEIVDEEGLAQVSDEQTLRAMVFEVLAENPEQVATYKSGKATVIGWFVGQVMRKTRGKANPQLAQTILEEELSDSK